MKVDLERWPTAACILPVGVGPDQSDGHPGPSRVARTEVSITSGSVPTS